MNGLLDALAAALQTRQWTLCTAESCTGGLIAATCTELSGSSVWFDRGFVTYSNAAKTQMLGVPASLITQHGSVSEAVAKAMAEGAVRQSGCQVSVAVTGIAGPTGGSPEKPVGTVWIAWHVHDQTETAHHVFSGDRQQVRNSTVLHAVQGLLDRLSKPQQEA
ncbi:CinA family protein [Limnohabitans sp.]|uniref:CinA family protein n=1 Tax=Limnohabitans sp. TaxID=1907725 RepID=UPI00311DD388